MMSILDGSNYNVWKPRMRTYIKSIDTRCWNSILTGYSLPLLPDADGDLVPKPEVDWDNDERALNSYNEKALNAMYQFVDPHFFTLIQNYVAAKDAWAFLETHCEGTENVKGTKFRMLMAKFENMRMEEGYDVSSFFEKLINLSNQASNLGHPISNPVLCLLYTSDAADE